MVRQQTGPPDNDSLLGALAQGKEVTVWLRSGGTVSGFVEHIEDRTRVLAAGFQAYLSKPVEPTELTAVVASLARAARNS